MMQRRSRVATLVRRVTPALKRIDVLSLSSALASGVL